MIFNKYQKELSYSYVFGAFGTIELLKNKVHECIAVLVDPSFINNEAFKTIKDICNDNNIQIIVDLKTISKIRDKGNIFVIGVFKKYKSSLSNNKHLVLYNINDTGCIGTIIRSMAGFDFSNLVLIDCNIDLFDEHLIRSTMGAFFKTNIKEYKTIKDYTNEYKNQEYINITSKGNSLSTINTLNNISLIFSKNPLEIENIKHIAFKENISLDNIVNIVLFTLYK